MTGHLFIVDGDLTRIACDAVLLPTDASFNTEERWMPLRGDHELPSSWNSEIVLPLDSRPKEPRVWVGNLGVIAGDDSGFATFESVIRQFVQKAAEDSRSRDDDSRLHPWPRPRLAINVVGSGLGGGAAKKGDLIRGHVTALQGLAAERDVDIVLVTCGRRQYAAAQRARRQIVGDTDAYLGRTWRFGEGANPDLIAEARRLAGEAIDNRLVLFIGAGVSRGAGLPSWDQLLKELAQRAGITAETLGQLTQKDLRDQATVIERRLLSNGGKRLRSEITDTLSTNGRYALQHVLLASLPSHEAITTNYDTLFEDAYRTEERDLAVLPDDPRLKGGHWLLKLHGSVDDPESIVLSRSDYLEMPHRRGALMGLVQALLLMRHTMFVGYSLRDEDFHELMHEVRAARGSVTGDSRQIGTALTLRSDHLERELWQDDLHIVSMMRLPEGDRSAAARNLEIFLDLVGYLSTTSAAFFLDPTFASLCDDEEPLRHALEELDRFIGAVPEEQIASVAHRVRAFLDELGAKGQTAR